MDAIVCSGDLARRAVSRYPGDREGSLHLSEDKCPKCGWKAPAGLLKCPFCKTYIRKPGGSSSELKVPDAATLARAAAEPEARVSPDTKFSPDARVAKPTPAPKAGPPSMPGKPTPPPTDAAGKKLAKEIQRELGRALFDDSDALRALERSEGLEESDLGRVEDADEG